MLQYFYSFLLACLLLATYRLGTTARNAAADGIVDAIDTGGAGTIQIRTGTQPTNVSDAPTGTLLGTCTFSATAFGSASSGVATASSITSDTSADASGTAGYFVIKNGAGTNHSDGTCGTSGADMNFDNNVIVAGGTIAITSMTVTQQI
jgi:hypothetical protein